MSLLNVTIGVIDDCKFNKVNLVKYTIKYIDNKGKERKIKTNWTANRGYKTGDSIPLRYIAIPCLFKSTNVVTEIDDLPQSRPSFTIVMSIMLAILSFIFGFLLATLFKKDE